MASATRADFLPALPPAPRRGQLARRRPAPAPLNGWLPALPADSDPALSLPPPPLALRYRSATWSPLAPSYLRLSLAQPLPATLLARRPKIWLFAAHSGPAGWHHPAPGLPTAWSAAALATPGAHLDLTLTLAAGPPLLAWHFALVVAAPAGAAVPASRVVRSLCAKVWLQDGASGRQVA